ncbi:hypothetical protein EJ07DRAFT_154544 [Lizonia empirigonia]|nr:hypothetical protein EJ07DRAFT_154544 [Lizonia empirigonia]
MVDEAALSPSQVKKYGKWWPIRHKSCPTQRPSVSISLPRRLSSAAKKMRRPMSIIKEDVLSLKSNSSVSLRLRTPLPAAWTLSSDHLIFIHPSRQLQDYQSVSYRSAYRDDEVAQAYLAMPRLYRTQSQWTPPSPVSYVPSGFPMAEESMTVETSATSFIESEGPWEPAEHPLAVDEDLPREAIADLFQRVGVYEQEPPDRIKDAGKVWVRVSEAGQGLTKTLKTMGSLRRKQPFEARLHCDSTSMPPVMPRNMPFRSQIRIYEKPTRRKRICITVDDWWRRFRNWSCSRDKKFDASNFLDAQGKNVTIVSFDLTESHGLSALGSQPESQHQSESLSQSQSQSQSQSRSRSQPQSQPQLQLSTRAPRSAQMRDNRPVRTDSKHSAHEHLVGRNPDLFPEVDDCCVKS